MSTPGWYPDPGGRPGAYRYWDGHAWSGQTTTRPRPSPGDGRQGSRRGIVLVVVAVVLVIVLAITGILVARTLTGGAQPITDPQPESTVSAWDDSKPTASPTPSPSPSPSPSPTPSGTPTRRERISCPNGAPGEVAAHPNDGRVHGGKLSFPKVGADYGSPGPKHGLSWFYDVAAQSQLTEPGWESWFAVGEVAVQSGFEKPADAAESSMQCVINPSWFSDFESRTDVRNEAYELDGRKGWIISAEIRVDNPSISVDGDVVTIMIIDDGRTDRYSGFVSIVPIGDGPRNELAKQTLADLRLD
ncbi:DUF2510 domain-containing protein [Microlunatus sp. GCM10028923]|uniref:DUF2510 domain-containing protein n=1 Tax=Microlunatus sp. GCM10028923 TaxID=3273400 RepID=UPI003619EAC8